MNVIIIHVPVLIHYDAFFFFFFNDTATTEIYTLSLHDALPICTIAKPEKMAPSTKNGANSVECQPGTRAIAKSQDTTLRSEEHTSELQSQSNLVCRLLLEKKKGLVHSMFIGHIIPPTILLCAID